MHSEGLGSEFLSKEQVFTFITVDTGIIYVYNINNNLSQDSDNPFNCNTNVSRFGKLLGCYTGSPESIELSRI